MNKAVIYCRVSTGDQDTQNQLDVLKAWADRRGLEVVRTYSETASAWTAGHQVQLKRLVLDAHHREFDYVLVWALDRITRQGPLEILRFVDKLGRWGIKVNSYQEPWTEAPGELGDLLYSLTAWVARLESQRRSERTKAGLERKKHSGWKPGRPKGKKDSYKRKRRTK